MNEYPTIIKFDKRKDNIRISTINNNGNYEVAVSIKENIWKIILETEDLSEAVIKHNILLGLTINELETLING